MTSRNEHRANKRAGLVYVAGWIKADDLVKWSDMTKAAPWVLTDQERKAIATAIRTAPLTQEQVGFLELVIRRGKDLTKSGEDQQ